MNPTATLDVNISMCETFQEAVSTLNGILDHGVSTDRHYVWCMSRRVVFSVSFVVLIHEFALRVQIQRAKKQEVQHFSRWDTHK